ncbi:MAG: glycosyltransferase family 39 protein [Verrucomicrobiaceae bacterium]
MPPPSRHLELALFWGVLALYAAMTVLADRPDMVWDEGRYRWYAGNLAQGFYNTPDKPDIINGPGYPLVLAPLIALGSPLIVLRGLNAVFMALAAWFSFRAVLPYAGRKWALGIALVTALHPSVLRVAPRLMTEPLTLACVAGFAWAFTAALRAEKLSWMLLLASAFAFGWLTLTRVFFGNVLLASAGLLAVVLIFSKHRERVLRALLVLALAFGMCVPWLAYTHSRTGEWLCWSTNGGELLYWATSTKPGENGHWFSEEESQTLPELVANGHRDFYKANYYLPVLEREAALKARAMQNIRENPSGVLWNWLCNQSRLLFGFPRSHLPVEWGSLLLVGINGVLVAWIGFSCWQAWRQKVQVPTEVIVLALLTVIYLGGSGLLPGLPRYTVVIWPWVGLVAASLVQMKRAG